MPQTAATALKTNKLEADGWLVADRIETRVETIFRHEDEEIVLRR
jgi:hypothetical protein